MARARSGERDERSTWRALAGQSDLVLLAIIVLLFQTANGAILPFLAQARTAAGSNPSIVTGVMTVVARMVMIVAALAAPHVARRTGYGGVMSLTLATVVVRAMLAAFAHSWTLVIIVQLLEGVSMGLSSVAIPALNAALMAGTGRVSAGFGAVLTAFGLGATLSPLLAGFVSQAFGFDKAFVALAIVAAVALAIWLVARRLMQSQVGGPTIIGASE